MFLLFYLCDKTMEILYVHTLYEQAKASITQLNMAHTGNELKLVNMIATLLGIVGHIQLKRIIAATILAL